MHGTMACVRAILHPRLAQLARVGLGRRAYTQSTHRDTLSDTHVPPVGLDTVDTRADAVSTHGAQSAIMAGVEAITETVESVEAQFAALAAGTQQPPSATVEGLVRACSQLRVPADKRIQVALTGLRGLERRGYGRDWRVRRAELELLLGCGRLGQALRVAGDMRAEGQALGSSLQQRLRTALLRQGSPAQLCGHLLAWANTMADPKAWARHALAQYVVRRDGQGVALLVATMLRLQLPPPVPACTMALQWLQRTGRQTDALRLARSMLGIVEADSTLLHVWVALEGACGSHKRAERLLLAAMQGPCAAGLAPAHPPMPGPVGKTCAEVVQGSSNGALGLWLCGAMEGEGRVDGLVLQHTAEALGRRGAVDGLQVLLQGADQRTEELQALFCRQAFRSGHQQAALALADGLVCAGSMSSKGWVALLDVVPGKVGAELRRRVDTGRVAMDGVLAGALARAGQPVGCDGRMDGQWLLGAVRAAGLKEEVVLRSMKTKQACGAAAADTENGA